MQELKNICSSFREYLVALLGIVLLASAFKLFMSKRRFFELGMKLPGPAAYPIIGNALKFACKPEQLLDRLVSIMKEFAEVSPLRFWMGPELYVAITKPCDIEIVMNSQQATNKADVYRFFYPFIGDGLISGSGKTWKRHRKVFTYIINHRSLSGFIECFDRQSRKLVEKLELCADGTTFDVFDHIEDCTIDMFSEVIMGCTEIRALVNPKDLSQAIFQMYETVHERMMKLWLHSDWMFRLTRRYQKQQQARAVIDMFTKQCLEICKRDLREGKPGISILHKLVSANEKTKEMSDEEMRDEIFTIYLASQDTVSVICSFAVLMLGIHRDVQEKARAEVRDVLGDAEVSMEHLPRLKYLEMVIKETLRLFPIGPLLVRRLVGELKLSEYVLPKDCTVVILAYGVHRSPIYWDKPELFVPERFEPDQVSNRHPYSYVPFSAGAMGCIGKSYAIASLKTILANILRKFDVKSKATLEDLKLRTDISIRSADGYKISLELL